MGALYGARCLTTQSDAVDSLYSVSPPYSVIVSGYLHVYSYSKIAGSWKLQDYYYASATPTLNGNLTAPIPVFPDCDLGDTFADGMILGWGVAGAMIVAWLVKNLRRGL